jgi:hypothetical protein
MLLLAFMVFAILQHHEGIRGPDKIHQNNVYHLPWKKVHQYDFYPLSYADLLIHDSQLFYRTVRFQCLLKSA